MATASPLEDIAQHVTRLATEVAAFLHESQPPWIGTPAGGELSHDGEYAGAWGNHPVQQVLLLPATLLLHTDDHLSGIAGVLRAPETVMTHQTLTRAALASCAVTHHVLEPGIGVRERLRRGMNVYLLSFAEQINMTDDQHLDALVQPFRRMEDIVNAARAHGFGVSKATRGLKKIRRPIDVPHLGVAPLSEMELVRQLVSGDDDDPVGLLVYRMGSAFTHGQPHVLNMLNLQRLSSPVEGMGLARVGVSTAEVVRDTAPIVYGVHRTMLRACEHYGWDIRRWQTVAQPAVRYWAEGLQALPR